VKAWALLAVVEGLGLAGCVSPLSRVDPGAFQAHARLAVLAFDAYDWTSGRPTAPTRSPSDTLAAAHQAFLTALAGAQLDARDAQVTAPCQGDVGDLCTRLSVPGLSPVSLSPAVAQGLLGAGAGRGGAAVPADLLVEVHVLTDFHRDGFWSRGAGNPNAETPILFVRAFNAQGKQVWEDQEMLDLPLRASFEQRWVDFDVAVQSAAIKVVARLAEQARARPR
jgi:hypothetical protein